MGISRAACIATRRLNFIRRRTELAGYNPRTGVPFPERFAVPPHDPEIAGILPQQVFAILSADVDRCFERLESVLGGSQETGELQYGESEVRSYVRAVFACMEGMTFCMRVWASEGTAEHHPEAQEGALEEWADLESNVKSMFTQLDSVRPIEPQIGTGRQWWINVQNACLLRSRITHPQQPTDLALSREEILSIVDADAGFRLLLSRYLEG